MKKMTKLMMDGEKRKNEKVIEGRKKANGVLYLREYGWAYLLWGKYS